MPDDSNESSLEKIIELLLKHGVEFLVGGQAEWLMGSPRLTFDVDLCYQRNTPNLQKLAAALRELGVRLRNAPPDLPFILDEQSLALGCNFTFNTPITDLDLLGYVEPLGGYEQLAPNAETYDVGGHEIKTIGLDDLIKIREHINRPKDMESLYQLRAIKQVRESG